MAVVICSVCGEAVLSDQWARGSEAVGELCRSCRRKALQEQDPTETLRVVHPEASVVDSPHHEDKQSTLFHPKLILRGEDTPASSGVQSTGRPPALRPYSDACFVDQLTSDPYFLQGDCTVFNLAEADLHRDRERPSDPCFQVEVMEKEFFLKNLSEENDLYLNGRKVGYCELRDGDELRLGDWVLHFQIRA